MASDGVRADPDGTRRRATFPPCTTRNGEHCANCPRYTLEQCIADLIALEEE